jgi:hypothetical protein
MIGLLVRFFNGWLGVHVPGACCVYRERVLENLEWFFFLKMLNLDLVLASLGTCVVVPMRSTSLVIEYIVILRGTESRGTKTITPIWTLRRP